MVIAPSDSLHFMTKDTRIIAEERFSRLGLEVSYAKNATEVGDFNSSSVASRVDDLHEAFMDESVKGVFTAFGGYNCNQILQYLDWDIIRDNPKILIGFSDTTALQNAIYAKTGLVTYSGPPYSRFGQKLYFDYTLDSFKECLFQDKEYSILPSKMWSDDWWLEDQDKRKPTLNDNWLVINQGKARGRILGANIGTFNLLQGTEFFPDLSDSVLFLEDDDESKIFNFDRDLQSLIHLPEFKGVRGIVIGRFQKSSKVEVEQLVKVIKSKKELDNIPVVANVDFGHTDPMITFPVGGEIEMIVYEKKLRLRITSH